MWGPKKNSKLSIALYISIHVLAATLVFSCEKQKSFYQVNRSHLNIGVDDVPVDDVPTMMENPDDPVPDMPPDLNITEDDKVIVDLNEQKPPTSDQVVTPEQPEDEMPEAQKSNEDDVNPIPPEPVMPKEEPVIVKQPTPPARPTPQQPKPSNTSPSTSSSSSEASKFIKVAYWVVQNEAKKLGTPCNFYVSRVLELSGYSDDGFLANDFDVYARKHFSSYKDEKFLSKNLSSEQMRLKRYLWGYPARTPFILQWERPAPQPGHIAIVERVGNQLVIYQASLNRHIARREQTTIDRLLNTSRGARVTVYSEFVAR